MTTLQQVRRFLFVILVLGLTGTGIELILLSHFEDTVQLVPLVVIGAGLGTAVWHAASANSARSSSALALRVVMVLTVAAGLAGIYFHYAANVEFQLETDPSLGGRALLWHVLQAKAPPALAPGSLVQLGLIGLAYTHRGKGGQT